MDGVKNSMVGHFMLDGEVKKQILVNLQRRLSGQDQLQVGMVLNQLDVLKEVQLIIIHRWARVKCVRANPNVEAESWTKEYSKISKKQSDGGEGQFWDAR